jgi:hypothetical protein
MGLDVIFSIPEATCKEYYTWLMALMAQMLQEDLLSKFIDPNTFINKKCRYIGTNC